MDFEIKGLEELRTAVRRNPAKVLSETRNFLSRGIAAYKRIIIRNPWQMGGSGGGAPKDTGNLRDTHVTQIRTWEALIKPTAKYAPYVHGIEGWPRKRSYQLRPWLDYAEQQGDSEIRQLEVALLENIVKDLSQ